MRTGVKTNEEREQTLNQLLTEMDGFTPDIGVVFIGATNRADLLDPALLRSGRFDRKVRILRPDADARYEILKVGCTGYWASGGCFLCMACILLLQLKRTMLAAS